MQPLIRSCFLFLLAFILFTTGCSSTSPVQRIIKDDLANVPEWSIILEDMKEEGFFSTNYFHKYKILTGTGDTTQNRFNERTTDWIEVPSGFYHENETFLGMVLASKVPNQKLSTTPTPPGYQYVGNPQYGRWRQDNRGNSFWEFYGKYALFRDLLFGSSTGGLFGGRNIYRDDYHSYRRYTDSGRPFYGRRGEFGTYGTMTEKTKPSFFERKKARMAQRKRSFSSRARSKMGRSRRSSYSRSRSFGK